jgi:hypothetical protein
MPLAAPVTAATRPASLAVAMAPRSPDTNRPAAKWPCALCAPPSPLSGRGGRVPQSSARARPNSGFVAFGRQTQPSQTAPPPVSQCTACSTAAQLLLLLPLQSGPAWVGEWEGRWARVCAAELERHRTASATGRGCARRAPARCRPRPRCQWRQARRGRAPSRPHPAARAAHPCPWPDRWPLRLSLGCWVPCGRAGPLARLSCFSRDHGVGTRPHSREPSLDDRPEFGACRSRRLASSPDEDGGGPGVGRQGARRCEHVDRFRI